MSPDFRYRLGVLILVAIWVFWCAIVAWAFTMAACS